MDTFMDKLAQRLTAQEMIKANMAADAEEMDKLKSTAKEYSECLEQMQKLVDTGVKKLEDAKVDSSQIERLVEESILRINDVQKDTEVRLNEEVHAVLAELKKELTEKPEVLEEVKQLLSDKLDNVDENVHKECVKVYRNVQAVVVEENSKQTENITAAVKKLRGKLNGILGVSIAALIISLGSLVIQILNMMNFKFF